MRHKNPLKSLQHCILVAAIFASLTSLTYATDPRVEGDATPDTQSEAKQPQQQATPAQPTVEPLDDDDDTYLV